MGKSEGEPQRSDGQPCPALLKNQASEGKTADNGEDLRFVQASPEELAAIEQMLAAIGSASSDLSQPPTKSRCRLAGLRLAGVLFLFAAVGGGLACGFGHGSHCAHNCSHKTNPVHATTRHTIAGRRRSKSVPDGPSAGNDDGGLTVESGGAEGQRPECVVRAEMLRQPAARRPMPDDESAVPTIRWVRAAPATDDIRAMLAEIRAGVAGLAMGPPVAGEFEKSEVRSQNAELRGRTAEILNQIGQFQYRPGFEDVWFGGEHYDLRKRRKARLCLEYLVARKAFDVASARHFENEIDPYVRKKGRLGARGKFSDIQIKQYFNDREGRLPKLRKALIRSVAGNGKYYLSTGAT